MKSPTALAVFARAPIPGRAKTRLIPALGPEGAARFQQALLDDTLRGIRRWRGPQYLFLSEHGISPRGVRPPLRVRRQSGGDLGERLQRALGELLKRHDHAIVIGTDSPLLPWDRVRQARDEIQTVDAVLGPCPDGGYYLIGLRRIEPGLLKSVRWGTRFAFADTLKGLLRAGFSCSVLESWGDVDRPRDLLRLYLDLGRQAGRRRRAPSVWRFLRAWRPNGVRAQASRKRRRSSPRRPLHRRYRRRPLGRA